MKEREQSSPYFPQQTFPKTFKKPIINNDLAIELHCQGSNQLDEHFHLMYMKLCTNIFLISVQITSVVLIRSPSLALRSDNQLCTVCLPRRCVVSACFFYLINHPRRVLTALLALSTISRRFHCYARPLLAVSD